MLTLLESFYFILPPSAFILSCDMLRALAGGNIR